MQGDPVPLHAQLRSNAIKVPSNSSPAAELSDELRISSDRQRRNDKDLLSRNDLKNQGLNSRGIVDQIMKEVKKQGGLNAEIQSRIGHQLRAMYDDVVRQGVPDRFAELIKKLDGPQEATAQAGGDGDKNNGGD
jgi:Anti-sigma factor NepR